MRLCTVTTKELPAFFGLELNKRIIRIPDAARLYEFPDSDVEKLISLLTYLENLPASEKLMRKLLKEISEKPKALARPAADGKPCFVKQDGATYLPPVQRPSKILCIGLNYRDHCEEQNKEIPKTPLVFNKFMTSLVGDRADIVLPHKVDKCIDYEAELAFVIGKRARRVTKRTAMKHVAGYMIMNDVSARTLQAKEKQWSRAKGFDGSGPCGPVLVTADEIPDPHTLKISCHVNGKKMQSSNTEQLVFKIPELFAYITKAITLEPGDIVSTGTPGGVGVYRDPQIFLKDGDVVEVKIDRIGSLVNKCVVG